MGLLYVFVLCLYFPVPAFAVEIVNRIKIEGNRRIEKQAILEKIGSRVGRRLSPRRVEKDIRALHKLGFFNSVRVDFEKGVLIYKFVELPTIQKIFFEGNSEVSTEDLEEAIKVSVYGIYDEVKVHESIRELAKLYEGKGFYLAKISYDLLHNKKEGTVNLTFKIQEYDKVRIKKITFLGNKAFTGDKLRDVLQNTKEYDSFSWLTDRGNFKELDFKTDIQRLQIWYLNEGYVRFRHDPPIVTVSEDKRFIYITVKVYEGKKYKIGSVDFAGDLLLPKGELRTVIKMVRGETFSIIKRNQDVLALVEKYQDLGYANVNVIPRMEVDDKKLLINTIYEFEKGQLVYFGRIDVKGNVKTHDKVVRRELDIKEGELYSGTGMRRSKENVIRLGFFEPQSVNFVTSSPKGQVDVVDVEVNVKDKPTGSLDLGAGYGTASRFFFTAEAYEANFLGLGQDLRFSTQLSADRQTRSVTFSLTDPYAFDTKWSVGGTVFYTTTPTPNRYLKFRRGFHFRLGYPIYDYTRLFMSYKFERIKLEQVVDPFVKEDLGREEGVLSSINASLIYDKRNNRLLTTGGYYFDFTTEFAGLGGNRDYLLTSLDVRYFKKLWGDLVMRTKFEVGKIVSTSSGRVQSTERFYLGGAYDLKGYSFYSVGPVRSITNDEGKVISRNEGGLNKAFYILELEYPLIKEIGLKLVAFYDAGDAFNSKNDSFHLHHDYGWGIRWNLLPLGVLRFEWGYPINPPEGRDERVFNFVIGPSF